MQHDNGNLDKLMPRDGFSPDWPQPSARPGLGLRLLLRMFARLRIGTLDVRLPGGELRSFRGAERPELHGVLYINDAALVRDVALGGEVGLGEAYVAGRWDSPHLADLLVVLYLNEPYFDAPADRSLLRRLAGWLTHRLRANTPRQARRNIEYHYDLGNEFYRLWLDDTLAYSSGIYPAPHSTLHEAQLKKFRRMFARLDLAPHHTLLEIGSGWGGFAIYCALASGCRVHSITLSKEQLAEAQRRAQAAGVADRVSFELRDYRDIQGQYDRVVSIEMYEAVGEQYWPGYFAAIARALKPGGRAALQGITIHPEIFDAYRRKIDFIQKYIFPGGMLATPGRIQDLAACAGLASEDPRFHAADYAQTLAHWHRNVLAQREPIAAQFGERFLRMWRYYLAYCECGFRVERVNLMQVTFRKPL